MVNSSADGEHQQQRHLGLVRALSQELTAAIAAIERNDLQGFQSTIANQERLCNELALKRWSPVAVGTEQRAIHQAYTELAQLNRVYLGVIKRSKRCADLLLALYGATDTGYVGATQINREGLACEA